MKPLIKKWELILQSKKVKAINRIKWVLDTTDKMANSKEITPKFDNSNQDKLLTI